MAFNRQQSNDEVEINRDSDSRPNNQRRRGDGNDGGERNNQRRGRDQGGDGQQRRRDKSQRNRGRGNRDGDDREDKEETKQPRKAANNKPREQIFNNNDAFPEL